MTIEQISIESIVALVEKKFGSTPDPTELADFYREFCEQNQFSKSANFVTIIEKSYETVLEKNKKRRQKSGTFYTPSSIVDRLIQEAMRVSGFDQSEKLPRVLDPACGSGAFLRGILRWYHKNRPQIPKKYINARLFGVDVDPVGIALAKIFTQKIYGVTPQILQEDALQPETLQAFAPFDLIFGNPPFGNAIKKQNPHRNKEQIRSLFPNATTGAYDKAGLFLELASQQLSSTGVLAFLLSRAFFAAPYATRLRTYLTEKHTFEGIFVSAQTDHFHTADVHIAGILLSNKKPHTQPKRFSLRDEKTTFLPQKIPFDQWGTLISPYATEYAEIPSSWTILGDIVNIQASATTGEAYKLKKHIIECPIENVHDIYREYFLFITTGAIDPFENKWGKTTQRYLRKKFKRPIFPKKAVKERRQKLYSSPKVLVSGLGKVLEAIADEKGVFAGAVATLSVTRNEKTPHHFTLNRIVQFLHTMLARHYFLARFGALAMSGGSVQITKKKLATLRVPPLFFEPPNNTPITVPNLPKPSTHYRASSAYKNAIQMHAISLHKNFSPACLLDRNANTTTKMAYADLAVEMCLRRCLKNPLKALP